MMKCLEEDEKNGSMLQHNEQKVQECDATK